MLDGAPGRIFIGGILVSTDARLSASYDLPLSMAEGRPEQGCPGPSRAAGCSGRPRRSSRGRATVRLAGRRDHAGGPRLGGRAPCRSGSPAQGRCSARAAVGGLHGAEGVGLGPGCGKRGQLTTAHSESLIFTWWLCSACQMTSPVTVAPSAGSTASRGMAVISARPIARARRRCGGRRRRAAGR